MEKTIWITNPFLSKENRSQDALLRTFDLPGLIDRMKHEQSWKKRELNAKILVKTPEMKIVLTALHEGSEINSFQSNDSVTFQILEGKLKFHAQKDSVTLDKDQMLTVHENIKYSLTTKEDTVFLLTISTGIMQPAEN